MEKSVQPTDKPAPNMDDWRTIFIGVRHCRRQRSASQLHQLFFHHVDDMWLKLWATHKIIMAENILRRIQRQTSEEIVTCNDAIYNVTLVDLDTRVQAMGSQGIATFGLQSRKCIYVGDQL